MKLVSRSCRGTRLARCGAASRANLSDASEDRSRVSKHASRGEFRTRLGENRTPARELRKPPMVARRTTSVFPCQRRSKKCAQRADWIFPIGAFQRQSTSGVDAPCQPSFDRGQRTPIARSFPISRLSTTIACLRHPPAPRRRHRPEPSPFPYQSLSLSSLRLSPLASRLSSPRRLVASSPYASRLSPLASRTQRNAPGLSAGGFGGASRARRPGGKRRVFEVGDQPAIANSIATSSRSLSSARNSSAGPYVSQPATYLSGIWSRRVLKSVTVSLYISRRSAI